MPGYTPYTPYIPCIPLGVAAAYLPGYLVTLWFSAALWTELVEAPFATLLKQELQPSLTGAAKREGNGDEGAAAPPPTDVPGARARRLFQTMLRVGCALAVGIGTLLLMHIVPSPSDDGWATNMTNTSAIPDAIPPQTATTVSSMTFVRSTAARNASHTTSHQQQRLRNGRQALQPRPEEAGATTTENTCEWNAESPGAAASGRGRFVAISKGSPFFSLTGRWVDEEVGGILADWSPGATVGFQVNGTDHIHVAAHRRCATRGLSGRGAVCCCAPPSPPSCVQVHAAEMQRPLTLAWCSLWR